MRLIEKLKGILSKPDASVSDLRAALADIDVAALEAAVTAAERVRAGLLLDGTEVALDRADEALKHAVRDRDRGIAAKAELARRLAEAEAAVAAEAFEAERSAAVKEANEVEKLLRNEWPKRQAELVTILKRLDAAEERVAQMNARLQAAGREDAIAPIETRVWPAPQHELAAVHSIKIRTMFRALPGVEGWGPA